LKTLWLRSALFFAAALLGLPEALAQSSNLSRDWVSTDWEVRCPRPDSSDAAPCEGQETAAAVFQGYLESSSQWYESLGFLGPKVVAPFGNYQAQIVRSEDAYSDGEPYIGLYDPSKHWIYLNEDYFFALGDPGDTFDTPDFRVEQSLIYTSVHEVFHAIQFTYTSSACGEGRGWICEGMADAALRAYADKFESEMNIAMDTRFYHEPLHQPSATKWTYGTWRFWLDVGGHLNSTDKVRYFQDILKRDLARHKGLVGVDHALKQLMVDANAGLWEESGLYELLPWFFARHDPDRIFPQPLQRSFRLEPGQASVEERITNIVVQPVAGRSIELTIDKPADTAVGVKVSFGRPNEDLHLIVDKVRYDKFGIEDRNVFFEVYREEQQLKFDVVIANVAKAAQMTRETNVDLVVELMVEPDSWVRLNGETFEVLPHICNSQGVVVDALPNARSISFNIKARGNSPRVAAWGDSVVGASLFSEGFDLSSYPWAQPDGGGSAGGPPPADNPPAQFQVDMGYDMERGQWTGSGTLHSPRHGSSQIEFSIQCSSANREIIR
jgi:hypothetical protein